VSCQDASSHPAEEAGESQHSSNAEVLAASVRELHDLSKRWFVAEEEYRRRLARELHDDVIQRLALLRIEAEQISLASLPEEVRSRLSRIKDQLGTLASDVRSLSHRLHPPTLEQLGLQTTLHLLVDDYRRAGLDVTFGSENVSAAIPMEIATSLYRIAQEALQNILKHAHDAPARVELKREGRAIKLLVEDRGPGFYPEQVRKKGGLGLISMEERARALSGTVQVISKSDEGTLIEVQIPLQAGDDTLREPQR